MSGARAGLFWLLGAGAAQKKYQEPELEPLGKKIRSQSRLKKKSEARVGAGAAKKFAGSPALISIQLHTDMFFGKE